MAPLHTTPVSLLIVDGMSQQQVMMIRLQLMLLGQQNTKGFRFGADDNYRDVFVQEKCDEGTYCTSELLLYIWRERGGNVGVGRSRDRYPENARRARHACHFASIRRNCLLFPFEGSTCGLVALEVLHS